MRSLGCGSDQVALLFFPFPLAERKKQFVGRAKRLVRRSSKSEGGSVLPHILVRHSILRATMSPAPNILTVYAKLKPHFVPVSEVC
jgi:hypothetical protein